MKPSMIFSGQFHLLDSLLLAEEDVVLVPGQRLPQSDVGGVHSVHSPPLTCVGSLIINKITVKQEFKILATQNLIK